MSIQPLMGGSVKKIAMAAQRSSALRRWSVWMFLLLEWGRFVGLVLQDLQEILRNAMVSACMALPVTYCRLRYPASTAGQIFSILYYRAFIHNTLIFFNSDIDECLMSNVCEQVCNNTEGGFFCTCKQGYQPTNTSHCEGIYMTACMHACSHVMYRLV